MATIFDEYMEKIEEDNDDDETGFDNLYHKIKKLMKDSGCDMEDIDLKVYYRNNIYREEENRIVMTFSEEEYEKVRPYAQNSEDDKELTNWIAAYYNQDMDIWEGDTSYKFYERLTDEAIKSNNQKGVEILFRSISYFDCSCPNYEHAIEVAAEFGNVATFLYVLFANLFAGRIDGREMINKERLVSLSEKNPNYETREFILKNIRDVQIPDIFE